MNPRDIFPRPLQYLIAIAEYGSFTKAAEALYVSQPTLSQQIKHLEEMLDLPLLDRTGKHVRLTDAGETYIYHAKRAWAELEAGTRAVNDVQNLTRGSLRLGWTPITDFLTCTLLDHFNRHYPGITLSTLELPADEIEIAVMEDRLDFGIAFSKPVSPVNNEDIRTRILFTEKLFMAIGNSNPRAGQKETISARQFAEEKLVMLSDNFALRRQIDQYCSNNDISPHISMETDSLSVIIEMIQVGSLATILPEGIIREQCGIHALPLAPSLPDEEITMICRGKGYKSPASIAFELMATEWSEFRLKQTPIKKIRPCPLSQPSCPLTDSYTQLTTKKNKNEELPIKLTTNETL